MPESHVKRKFRSMGFFDFFVREKTAVDYYTEGAEFCKSHQWSETLASADKGIALVPNMARLWFLRGTALNMLGRYAEAVESYDKIGPINKSLCTTVFSFSDGSVSTINKDKDYDALSFENMAIVFSSRGVALHNLDEYDKALSSFNIALYIDPNDPVANAHKEITLKKLGNPGK